MNALIAALIGLLQRLTAALQKRLPKGAPKHDTSINSLAPKILIEKVDLDRVKPYLESLKQAIDAEGITNIAVTGSYGSGKSTIIKTFQHQNPQYKYLNISLASFRDNKEDKEAFDRKLEVSILQQMFYHVKPSVIPDSRFKRIVNITGKKLMFLTVFLILWVLSTLTLFKFGYIEKLNPSGWKIDHSFNWIACITAVIFFIGIGLFLKNVYRLLSNSKISKLNIKGELELGEAVDKSVFNQHLEEILYFFERTDFNVVVIEDVDRFNSTDIFTKLREINILLNNSNLIRRPIKFVYAIKDEMFTDKNERVKFFEFIIPIIPFINPTNANDQLVKLINNANLQGTLSTELTSDVVTFIDDIDMRLLINIFQEYQIYKNVLSSSLKQDNLFAILVYKNMYPDDFGELSKRKGKLYKFLTDRKIYVKDLRNQIDAQIERANVRINQLENEIDLSVKELRAVYLYRVISKLPNFKSLFSNTDAELKDAVKDEHFDEIKTAANIKYTGYTHNYGNYYYSGTPMQSGISFHSVEREVSRDMTYEQREALILEKAANQINALKVERKEAKNRIAQLDSLSIKEIFELVNISDYLGDFKDSYLMRNLLLNGYIDEHFDDYISLFHEVSLTKDDFVFERSIKGGVSLPFDYQLSKTENLIRRLPQKYFGREAILNYSIIEFFLENQNKYADKQSAFYNRLSIDGERQFQFIYGFIKANPRNLETFVKTICNHKKGWWRDINKAGLPDGEIRHLVRLTFEHAEISDIFKLADIDSMDKYLEQMTDIFSFSSTFKGFGKIKEIISNRNLRFKSLDIPIEEQNELFDLIYKKGHYQINEHNIIAIIQGNKKEFDAEELRHAHYTTILKLNLKHLNDHISSNIKEYVSNVMITLTDNTNEAEETILNILNRDDIPIDLKEKLLVSQELLIHSIEDIDTIEVKQLALLNNSVEPSWENVFDYYEAVGGKDLDEVLITFLNSHNNYEALSQKELNADSDRDEKDIKNMSGKLLNCKPLTLNAFAKLLDSLPYVYTSINYDGFDTQRLTLLLEKKILTLSPENFNGLKEKGPALSTRLLEIHQSQFIKEYSEIPLEANDWLLAFNSPRITKQNKLLLIEKIDDSIIIKNKAIADIVCIILPTDRLIPLRYEVLAAMFSSNASVQKRIGLLNLHLSNLDDSQVQSLTEELGDDYAKIFMKQHKPLFPNHDFNIEFFDKLKERDLIIKYGIDDKSNLIRVFAKY